MVHTITTQKRQGNTQGLPLDLPLLRCFSLKRPLVNNLESNVSNLKVVHHAGTFLLGGTEWFATAYILIFICASKQLLLHHTFYQVS